MAYGRGLIGGMASIGRASQAPAYPISEEEQMRRMQANHMQPSASQPAPSTPARPGLIGSSMPRSAMLQPQQQPAKKNGILEMLGYDREATGMDPLKWVFSSREQVDKAREGVSDKQAYQDNLQRAVEAGLKGRDLMSYMANPEEWAKSEATNNEAANVGGGDSRYVNGAYQTAPVLGNQNGYAFTQTPNGVTIGDRFKPSYSDETGLMNAKETAANNARTAAETARNHRATEAQANQYTLGPDQSRYAGKERIANNPKPTDTGADSIFGGAQLATIYNKSMGNLEAVQGDQGRLDTIAKNAAQFVEGAKNYGSQGEGAFNDMGQFFSQKTTGLKQNSSAIAPLLRVPGSGSSSDKDVEMNVKAGVSINNTSGANQRFSAGSAALAQRNRQYAEFLTNAIDPRDPQSKQKADQIWTRYKEAVRIYDDQTGEVNPSIMSFSDWMARGMPSAATQLPTSAQPQTAPQQAPPSGGQQWGAPTPQRNNNGPMGSYRAPQAPQAGQPDPMDAHIDSLFADEGDGGGDGETFVNPQTGEEIRWNPQSGSWEAAN